MAQTRQQYIEECKQMISETNREFEPLIQYYRNKKNQRQGVVVALKSKSTGEIRYGASLCSKRDTWNREIALALAYQDAWSTRPCPHSLQSLWDYMYCRAQRYFTKHPRTCALCNREQNNG